MKKNNYLKIFFLFFVLFFYNLNNSKAQSFSEDEFMLEQEEQISDPYEKYNRKIFAFNENFDRYFFEHVARAYRKGVPHQARMSIRNFLNNLFLPMSVLNSILQGKTDNSLATMSHFLINSTIGVFGLFDVAGQKGIKYEKEDFGQTLGHYGVGSGHYLMLPFIGPSSTRDAGGLAFDAAINPLQFNLLKTGGEFEEKNSSYRIGISLAVAIDKRESLIDTIDQVRQDSFDSYSTIRSAYLQLRKSQINN
jgi:phospholipid-binding lipoprotein MlaA